MALNWSPTTGQVADEVLASRQSRAVDRVDLASLGPHVGRVVASLRAGSRLLRKRSPALGATPPPSSVQQ